MLALIDMATNQRNVDMELCLKDGMYNAFISKKLIATRDIGLMA